MASRHSRTQRALAIAYGRDVSEGPNPPSAVTVAPAAPTPSVRSSARYLWAMLLARLFESLPLTCPDCSADMRLITLITEAAESLKTSARMP